MKFKIFFFNRLTLYLISHTSNNDDISFKTNKTLHKKLIKATNIF